MNELMAHLLLCRDSALAAEVRLKGPVGRLSALQYESKSSLPFQKQMYSQIYSLPVF